MAKNVLMCFILKALYVFIIIYHNNFTQYMIYITVLGIYVKDCKGHY